MSDERTREIGKYLAYVLRHAPEDAGLEMDKAGWVDVASLVTALNEKFGAGLAEIEAIAAADEKSRYTLADTRIRANQGHSVPVDLGLLPTTPPPTLWHGTVSRFVEAIMAEGLKPGARQHVHLSPDRATAKTVGGRRGKPVILQIDAAGLAASGHLFYQSA
ncbi:MAG: RNA 2'-phosphotransferase, partial [Pseudomonadota bacterium]